MGLESEAQEEEKDGPLKSPSTTHKVQFEVNQESLFQSSQQPSRPLSPVEEPLIQNPSKQSKRDFFFRSRRKRTLSDTSCGGHSSASGGAGSLCRTLSTLSSTSSSSSSSSSASTTTYSFSPPDGGWGWVVVIASFLVNLIADGITLSFGIIFVELEAEFGSANIAATAGVFSMFHAMPLLSGPVASALADRFGCRRVTIAGALMASVGFILSFFCHTLPWLYLTFGIIAGLGLSLCFVTSILIIAYYFEKRRSFATGISVCGSGVGTLIFPPFIKYLINEYGGWRPATLILAGVLLNMCVCGALFRDLPWTRQKRRKKRARAKLVKSRTKRFSIGSLSSHSATTTPQQQPQPATTPTTMPSIHEVREVLESGGDVNILSLIDEADLKECPRLSSSLINIPTYISNNEKFPDDVLAVLSRNKDAYDMIKERYPDTLIFGSRASTVEGSVQADDDDESVKEDYEEKEEASKENGLDMEEPAGAKLKRKVSSLFRKRQPKSILKKPTYSHEQQQDETGIAVIEDPQHDDLEVGHSQNRMNLLHLRMRRQSLTYRGAMLNIKRYRLRASSCPDIYRNSMMAIPEVLKENDGTIPGPVAESCNAVLSAALCCNPALLDIRFVFFCLSNFILYAWYDVMYTYLLLYSEKDLAFPEENVTYFISIIGIMSTIGGVLIGFTGDRSWVNLEMLYAGCMFASGISTAFVPFLTDYSILAGMAGVYGFAISANYALTTPILVKIVSIEQFPNAYGLTLFIQGISNLVGPPFAGFLHEVSGSWFLTFALAGFSIALSGVFLLAVRLPCCKSHKEDAEMRRRRTASEMSGASDVQRSPSRNKNGAVERNAAVTIARPV